MNPRIVILGGGTGGTLTANRLRRALPTSRLLVVDQDGHHVYQPGLLYVPFGLAHLSEIMRPRLEQLHAGIGYRQSAVESVELDRDRVHLADGSTVDYDVLVVATGASLMPGRIPGLTGPGWMQKIFTFYTPEGAAALEGALSRFVGGRVVVNVVDMPIKYPASPLEFCFLADWYFHERGLRYKVDVTYVTPLDGAFHQPVASRILGDLLGEKEIELVTGFHTNQVDGPGGRLVADDGRAVPFDLAVVVPPHVGAAYVGRSPGLGDKLNFVPADEHTLQSKAKPNVFVIGDAASVPASKAGSVTHFEGGVLVGNISRHLAGQPLDASYDGHANWFIETGFDKALLLDFNYDTEPLPGHFPAGVGLPLLKESRLNHLGKLMFQWFYWHSLLPGRDIPGVTSHMPTAGKQHQGAGHDGPGRAGQLT